MINIQDKAKCTGCNACYSVCPCNCISMQEDKDGFRYPVIDTSKCINCNKCIRVCPLENKVKKNEIMNCYAMKNNDLMTRLNSSSGGIFTLLAKEIIKQDGIVCGALFDEYNNVVHGFVEKIDNLVKLRGSKYVQSEIGNVLKQTKCYLDNGRFVLFSGTPCQLAGLKKYLDKDYDNLLLVEVVCHGVPSNKMWKKYLDDNYFTSSDISFRNKVEGWNDFSMKIGKYHANLNKDPYLVAFLKDVMLRPACYSCQYKDINRIGDISLADFWGIRQFNRKIDDDKGVSLVSINTIKGEKFISSIKDKVTLVDVDIEKSINENGGFMKKPIKPKEYLEFNLAMGDQKFNDVVDYFYPFDAKLHTKKQIIRKVSNIKNKLLSIK